MISPVTVALVVGVPLFVGITRAIQTHRFVRRAVRTRARVMQILDATVDNPDTSSQSSSSVRYVVELSERGRKRRVALADAFGGSIADKFVADDQTIPVVFDPSKPGVVRIDSPWALYFVPTVLCVPAVLALSLVVYVWINE